MFYICIKFQENTSKGLRVTVIKGTQFLQIFTKGHNSVKTVKGVTLLVLFILSADALYLY